MKSRARFGETNPMSRHPDSAVVRARELHANGKGLVSVRKALEAEGINVSKDTLAGWLDWRNRVSAGGPVRGDA